MTKIVSGLGILWMMIAPFWLTEAASKRIGSIEGVITDQETAEPIYEARIILKGTLLKTDADRKGRFTFGGLAEGRYELEVSARNYTPLSHQVFVTPDSPTVNVEIELQPYVYKNELVIVPAPPPVINKEPEVSTIEVKPEEIGKLPGGVKDVNRLIQTLPGVVSGSDFSTLLYVRGGDIIETMCLLDRCYMMNPYHFGGVTTIFNPSVIDSVDFYAGGFPANYANALSGIVDVTYRDGNLHRFEGGVDISLIESNLRLEGPLGPPETSFLIAGRRTYYDLILKTIGNDDATAVPYFGDLFGKLTYQIRPGHKLSLELMNFIDSLEMTEVEQLSRGPDDEPGSLFYRNTNYFGILNYTGIPASGWLVHSTVSLSKSAVESEVTGTDPMAINAEVGLLQLTSDLFYQNSPNHELNAGFQLVRLNMYIDSLLVDWRFETQGANRSGYQNWEPIELDFPEEHSYYYGVFAQDRWRLFNAKIIAQLGLRGDYWDRNDEFTISPRFNVSYTPAAKATVKLAWGVFQQIPMNVLQLHEDYGNPELESERAIHYIVGTEFQTSKHTKLRAEMYYKDLQNLIANYDDSVYAFAQHFSGKPWFENSASGYSYGLELFFQLKPARKFDGWITYGYALTKRHNPLHTLNAQWFYPRQDQRHTLTWVLNYAFSKKIFFSGRFTLTTGKPYTEVRTWTTQHQDPDDPATPLVWVVGEYGGMNAERFPLYHRLDLKLERSFTFESWELNFHVNLMNAYNQKNLYSYYYDSGEPLVPPKREKIYNLPIIPFFGVDISF